MHFRVIITSIYIFSTSEHSFAIYQKIIISSNTWFWFSWCKLCM